MFGIKTTKILQKDMDGKLHNIVVLYWVKPRVMFLRAQSIYTAVEALVELLWFPNSFQPI